MPFVSLTCCWRLAEPLSEQEVKQVRDWEQVLPPLLLLCSAPFDEEGYIDLATFMVKDSSAGCFGQVFIKMRYVFT